MDSEQSGQIVQTINQVSTRIWEIRTVIIISEQANQIIDTLNNLFLYTKPCQELCNNTDAYLTCLKVKIRKKN